MTGRFHRNRRLLAMLLAAALVCGVLPAGFAKAEEQEPQQSVQDMQGEEIDKSDSVQGEGEPIADADPAADPDAPVLMSEPAPASDPAPPARDPQTFSIDSFLQELKLVITDSNGDHVVDYHEGDPKEYDLGTIDRTAQLGITLQFSVNEVLGNDENTNNNPMVFGDRFTCTVPDVLSNANGGKWEGRLSDTTTDWGMTNKSVGSFVIENGLLTIWFDEEYVRETKGNVKKASLNFNGSFNSYGWDESSFSKTLFFGDLPIKVTFPAETAIRNLAIEKSVERYSDKEYGSYTGSQGKTALNGSPKVTNDGYLTYTLKVTAGQDNTHPVNNVVISDTFTTDNIVPSSIQLTSVTKEKVDITASVVEQKENGVITGWNIGTMDQGEEAILVFKVKVDKDKLTDAVDQVKEGNPQSEANDERTVSNTAAVSGDKVPKVETTEDAKLSNYMSISKSSGSYDAALHRKYFTVTVSAPASNVYTQKDVSVRDSFNVTTNASSMVIGTGIDSVTIKHADNTTVSGTQDAPLYHDYSAGSDNKSWRLFLDEMKPGDTATIKCYFEIDPDKFYDLGKGSATSGLTTSSNQSNYAYVADLDHNYDLKTSSNYTSYSLNKTWVSKSAGTITADGYITWTVYGNSYSSNFPEANVDGFPVKDTLGSNLEFADESVLVQFERYNSTKGQYESVPYTGDGAEDGKLKVPVSEKSFEFNIPAGYGDCRYKITYRTKATNNYGPAFTYQNNVEMNGWKTYATTYRPRVAAMDKSQTAHGADWTEWCTKIYGTVSTGDKYTDTINTSADVMYMTQEQLDEVSLEFNGEPIDKNLYKITPTTVASGSNAGKITGFTIDFLGSIQAEGENNAVLKPTKDNPLKIVYRTKTVLPVPASGTYKTNYKYQNTGTITVDGVNDSDSDFFWKANMTDISKSMKKIAGSKVVWSVTVNQNGESTYPTKEGYDNYNFPGGKSSDNELVFTDTIPAGMRFTGATITGKGMDFGSVTPTIKSTETTQNDDGSTTVRITLANMVHYECNKGNYAEYSYASYHNYVWVSLDIETQIIDKEFLFDTTEQEFQWTNEASIVTRDGIPFSASAKVNAAHIAMTKDMVYTAATAPCAQFTIDVNPDKCDMNPDGDTVKVFDKSSPTLAIDTSSIKVIDLETKKEVNFNLDAGGMAADGTFSLSVPDNLKLQVTYNAYVSGVTGEEVSVSNAAYFEGQDITETTSRIEENIIVLNAAASAESNTMIWLKKMSAAGARLPDCKFRLDFYDGTDWVVKTQEIVTTDQGYGTKIGSLEKDVLYRLTETEAKDGYVTDATPSYFCLKLNKDSQVPMPADLDQNKVFFCGVAAPLSLYNNPYVSVKFIKNDADDQPVSGASFKVVDGEAKTITDKDGNEITFTSAAAAEVRNIAPGTYTLVETSAPAGYLKADPITFTVNTDQTVQIGRETAADNTVVCVEEPTKVQILKMDGSVDPAVPLSGAKLQILDGTTVVVDTWETTGTAKEITGVLAAGKTYTLHETEAPTGYLLAPDIEFSISEEDGTLQTTAQTDDDNTIRMTDTKPSLDIIKVDSKTLSQLSGVEMKLSAGDTLIREWKTAADKAEHFDNLEAGTTYTVTETKALPGYRTIAAFQVTPAADGTFTVTGSDAAYSDGTLTVKNVYSPTPVDVTLTVNKKLEGAPRPEEKEFLFRLEDKGGAKTDEITIEGEGTASFKPLTFTEGGIYTFTIREIAGEDAGYTYSAVSYQAVITVADDGKGTLTPTVEINGTEGTEAEFTNNYVPEAAVLSIPVEKVFTADSAVRTKDESFTFTIKAEDETAPMPEKDTITASEKAGGIFENIVFTETGTYTYTITEKDDKKPGYTYAKPQTITVTVADFDGQLGCALTVDGKEQNKIVFENGYHPITAESKTPVPNGKMPGTGDGGMPLFWAVLAALALFASMLIVMTKNKKYA